MWPTPGWRPPWISPGRRDRRRGQRGRRRARVGLTAGRVRRVKRWASRARVPRERRSPGCPGESRCPRRPPALSAVRSVSQRRTVRAAAACPSSSAELQHRHRGPVFRLQFGQRVRPVSQVEHRGPCTTCRRNAAVVRRLPRHRRVGARRRPARSSLPRRCGASSPRGDVRARRALDAAQVVAELPHPRLREIIGA